MIDPDGPLTGRKIVVTGGAGFVGSHIVGLLVEASAGEIVVVDNLVRGRRSNLAAYRTDGNVRLVEGDVRDRTLMARLLDGADTVFHQAALRITQCAVEPRAALQVMADATFDLLELSVAADVRKVVMASSASIYGLASTFPTPETQHPYDNRTLYGAAKMFGEGLLRAFHDMNGLDYVALRYFNVYGPRMDIHGKYTEVLIRWMERIEAGEAPLIFGDGLQTMDMIHVEDVARANILAATSAASDVALNVGSGAETSLLDLAKLLATRMGRPGLVPEHMPERGVNPVPRRLADTSLARDLIGFESEIELLTGLDEVIAWWRSERDRLSDARMAAE
ncbi:NAD-dependent epimerase/dehydratase family protein [Hansschlegelia quercus]|uniref:NAD-dependent epimerase/dehydratase family protein n=1 Tax=Hansschlegelia quercus TaxID=2528245 RepID=A0A4Q9GBR7_9HYPH|nr:NAD-dependent epimerase/dehydratase family protein [Hansschlegelia quercus]TBN47305.1 NAD-dependent epimerase/dehydratase family protein [Hansschlegelia quercus]